MKCPSCKKEFWDLTKRKMQCINCGMEVDLEFRSVIVPRFNSLH